MFVWLRELISSAFTFFICLVGIAALMDPDVAFMRIEELAAQIFQFLQDQTQDAPGQLNNFLDDLKRQLGR
ncbi:MAG: hypothetical protein JSS50_00890 [Proteobacteria bacterium]|nr:hypothetical protein [Pseudomonadota bacterium]